MSETPTRPPFFTLCRAEPFRIFFPLGVLAGISGVSLWPLYFSGMHQSFYPGTMHARMMIEGFMGAFVFGFLGTAVPRLTSTPSLSGRELRTLLVLYVVTVGTHIAEQPEVGDALFIVLLAVFARMLRSRFAERTELPPPGFVLVACGFGNAFAGTLLAIIGTRMLRADVALAGTNLLHVGWMLLNILGLGGFLLPRMLGLPPDEPKPGPEWNARAWFAGVTGTIISATLAAEAFVPFVAWPRALAAVRVAAAAAWLLANVPFHRVRVPNVTLTLVLRAALVLLIAGLAFPLCCPLQRAAGLHVIFLGGFSLMAFTVGTRVVLGHSGFSHLFPTRLWFLVVTALLILSATGLRVAGEFALLKRANLLNGASHAWMTAAVLWAIFVLPKVRHADPEG
jgi:uncharacterized protein involved in response to NO